MCNLINLLTCKIQKKVGWKKIMWIVDNRPTNKLKCNIGRKKEIRDNLLKEDDVLKLIFKC